jgi:hypothetical protein
MVPLVDLTVTARSILEMRVPTVELRRFLELSAEHRVVRVAQHLWPTQRTVTTIFSSATKKLLQAATVAKVAKAAEP